MTVAEASPRDCRLADLPVGAPAHVLSVESVDALRLAIHGFRPGVALTVEQDAPFGGPRIVRIGAARIAVAKRIAASVRVRPERPERPARYAGR